MLTYSLLVLMTWALAFGSSRTITMWVSFMVTKIVFKIWLFFKKMVCSFLAPMTRPSLCGSIKKSVKWNVSTTSRKSIDAWTTYHRQRHYSLEPTRRIYWHLTLQIYLMKMQVTAGTSSTDRADSHLISNSRWWWWVAVLHQTLEVSAHHTNCH